MWRRSKLKNKIWHSGHKKNKTNKQTKNNRIKFVSTRDYLIPPIWVCIPERVWAYEGCTSVNFPHYILSRNREEGFVSNGSKDILHDNKIFSCPMELLNKSASLVVIFVLFSFATSLWLHLLTKNTGKAFIHMTKINCLVMTLYEVFNRLRSISFFFCSFLWINEGIKRKHILHSSVADQSTGFLARSRVLPQRLNSREIGKTCQQKWKIQHQNHDDYDFLITCKREPRQRHH